MKLLMPNILKPALDLPLNIPVILEISKVEDLPLAKELIKKGWIVDE